MFNLILCVTWKMQNSRKITEHMQMFHRLAVSNFVWERFLRNSSWSFITKYCKDVKLSPIWLGSTLLKFSLDPNILNLACKILPL